MQLSEAMGNREFVFAPQIQDFLVKLPSTGDKQHHHRTLRVQIYVCCPVYNEKGSAQKTSLEHTWLLLKRSRRGSWKVLKAVRKQLLKATSNFSYYALLYQILLKGLSQDRVYLN